MSQLQGAIQYVANRTNVIGNDDITAIKEFPKNINYKYYIKEANKILAKLKIQEQGLFW